MTDRRHHLIWQATHVNGQPARYGEAGDADGPTVLFLHGWALGHHAYKRPLSRLVALGCHVYAPALPGFGGTPDIAHPAEFRSYAEWTAAFCDAVGITDKAYVVGHSFGGGVTIQFAHDHPDRVRSIVLVNAVGGGAWSHGSKIHHIANRPMWDWGIHFHRDLPAIQHLRKVLPVMAEDAIPNIIRNPLAIWRIGHLARTADLVDELEELKRRAVPVTVVWGRKDTIVPRASFDAICRAVGASGTVINGNHSWLLEDPDTFAEVVTNVTGVADAVRRASQRTRGT